MRFSCATENFPHLFHYLYTKIIFYVYLLVDLCARMHILLCVFLYICLFTSSNKFIFFNYVDESSVVPLKEEFYSLFKIF